MIISGLQKMTLLDYPGKVACTVFLQGCNFRCPFCHNSDLLCGEATQPISENDFLAFLKKRQGLLDAVCVSGGEPTLHPDLPKLLSAIRSLGYSVKLDTNGSRPDMLKRLLDDKLVDYVAMDVKNSQDFYPLTCGLENMEISSIEESLRLLMHASVPYELRTTVCAQLHNAASMQRMGMWLVHLADGHPIPALYIQPYVDRASVLTRGLRTPDETTLQEFMTILRPYVQHISLRGE
jgi:pyruvate formate lyase activating enzyme